MMSVRKCFPTKVRQTVILIKFIQKELHVLSVVKMSRGCRCTLTQYTDQTRNINVINVQKLLLIGVNLEIMNLLTMRVSDINADTLTVRLKIKNTEIQVTEVLMRGKDMEGCLEQHYHNIKKEDLKHKNIKRDNQMSLFLFS